jgi:GNAT superfamily N-acetyltransferase
MRIEEINISDSNKNNLETCLNCLKDWDKDFRSQYKNSWYRKYRSKGLKIKVASIPDNKLAGMIQYLPIEYSFATGENMNFIQCIWVHGYDEGIGNQQNQGLGKRLLEAAEKDTRNSKLDALVAWGMDFDWLPASWFIKQGFQQIDKDEHRILLWKKFNNRNIVKPSFIKKKKIPQINLKGLTISIFQNGWCTDGNIQCETAKKVYKEYKDFDKVKFNFYDTSQREIFLEWGIDYGVYVDNVEIILGPYSIENDLRKAINDKLRQL